MKKTLLKHTTQPIFSIQQVEKIISGTNDLIYLINAANNSLVAANESGRSFLNNTNQKTKKSLSNQFPLIKNYLNQLPITLHQILSAFKKNDKTNVFIIQHDDTGFTYELAIEAVEIDKQTKYIFIKMRDITHRITNKEEALRFVHTIGHELKQPLNLIKAYAYYIKRNLLPEQQKLLEYPIRIDQQVDILTSMLNDIVDTTKLSTQDLPINKEDINLVSLTRSVITDIRDAYPRRHFVLSAPKSVFLLADQLRLRQGIMNLCMNAVKYSDENSTITIVIKKSKTSVFFSISDQGIGIPKDELKKIFNPYFRTMHSKKKSTKGLGLGLSLVKEVIKLHNGTVSVESAIDRGSTFTIEFPLTANQ